MNDKLFEQRSNDTKDEAISILNKCGKCVILRPTGFGKTYIMSHIAAEKKYRRVLYVYPSETVKKQAEHDLLMAQALTKTEFISYAMMGRLNTKTDELKRHINNFDLVIFDEMHHMGAELVKKSLNAIIDKLDNIDILGGTATPKRMDGFDVIGEFFDNKIVTFYGLDNAIRDDIMPKPYYVYAVDGYKTVVSNIKKKIKSVPAEMITQQAKIDMRSGIKELSNLTNAPHIIKDSLLTIYEGNLPKYMRFMVFFQDKKELNRRREDVIKWFKESFSWYNVDSLVIHSSYEERQNLLALEALDSKPGQIDLIMSVNMLNEGYHVDDVTGVILLRPTQSATVYTQQIGRCMKVRVNYTPIIFDFVDNISIHSLYGVSSKKVISSDKTDAELTIEEQMDRLNSLSYSNIQMVDKVADIKRVVAKMSQDLPTEIEAKVIQDRMGRFACPATELARKHGIALWEVYNILDKYEYLLKPLGLHKQTVDFYTKGDIQNGKRIS